MTDRDSPLDLDLTERPIIRGEDWELFLHLFTLGPNRRYAEPFDATKGDQHVNITGWTGTFALRRNARTAPLVTASLVIVDATHGQARFVIDNTVTSTLTENRYSYHALANDNTSTYLPHGGPVPLLRGWVPVITNP